MTNLVLKDQIIWGGPQITQTAQLQNRGVAPYSSPWGFLMSCKVWQPFHSRLFHTSVTRSFKNNQTNKTSWISSPFAALVSNSAILKTLDCDFEVSDLFDYTHRKGPTLKNAPHEFQ